MELKIGSLRYLRSLIMNPSSGFRDSRWRIQYGGRKCKKLLDWNDIWYLGLIGVADYKSEFTIQKLKIADPIWRKKMKKLLHWDDIWMIFVEFGLRIRTQHSVIRNSIFN